MDFDDDFNLSYSSYDDMYSGYSEFSDPIIDYGTEQSNPVSPEVSDSNYQIANNDPSIIFSSNINQTKTFLRDRLNLPISSLRTTHPPGLVILRLEDFALIRNDSRCSRIIKHILYVPTQGSELRHPDFNTAVNFLINN